MIWRLIDKSKTKQPSSGNYREWKNILRKEGFYQCVYCAIHEARFGGLRNFHIEHYRPKSKFEKLKDDITNLFYSCAICNTFKGDDWPAEPQIIFTKSFYPSPSEVDYNTIFNWDKNTNIISGKNVTSRYVIEKLFLNRPQLITERRFASVRERLNYLTNNLNLIIPSLEILALQKNQQAIEVFSEVVKAYQSIIQLQNKFNSIIPYEIEDISR